MNKKIDFFLDTDPFQDWKTKDNITWNCKTDPLFQIKKNHIQMKHSAIDTVRYNCNLLYNNEVLGEFMMEEIDMDGMKEIAPIPQKGLKQLEEEYAFDIEIHLSLILQGKE